MQKVGVFWAFKCKLLLHIADMRLGVIVRQTVTPRWWFNWSLFQQPFTSLTERPHYLQAQVCERLFWARQNPPTPNVRNSAHGFIYQVPMLCFQQCALPHPGLREGTVPHFRDLWKWSLGILLSNFSRSKLVYQGNYIQTQKAVAPGLLTLANPKGKRAQGLQLYKLQVSHFNFHYANLFIL